MSSKNHLAILEKRKKCVEKFRNRLTRRKNVTIKKIETEKIQKMEPMQKMEPQEKPYQILQFHSKSALLKSGPLPKDALRSLSNFSEHPVEYDGHEYPSVEHAYQAQKYLCSNKPELARLFYDGSLKTPADAKSAGGKTGMKKNGAQLDIDCWNKPNHVDTIMHSLIMSKIAKNMDIRNILDIASKNNIRFSHFSRSDMYWGAHLNDDGTIKKGENKLGKIYNKYIDSL